MNGGFILSTAVLFFMLMDPFGNLPVFIARLRRLSPRRYTFIIWRESWIALLLMVLALLAGQPFLRMMHIHPSAVAIGGGVILLLMGVRMVFSSFGGAGEDDDETAAEPFIVPIAVPFICGPGLMAILFTVRGGSPEASLAGSLAALGLAWLAQTAVLLCGRLLFCRLGEKLLDAIESLLGLLLICLAVAMVMNGLHEVYGIGDLSAY